MGLEKALWFDGSGNVTKFSDMLNRIASKKLTHEIHIGGDSQPYHSYVVFATTVCLYMPGYGAMYYVTRRKSSNKAYKNLGLRLQFESELAIEAGNLIRERLNLTNTEIAIHCKESCHGL